MFSSASPDRVLCVCPFAKMSTRSVVYTILSVIVAGIVIAGTIVGWPTIISSVTSLFPSPSIESSAAGRFSSEPFFADEKIWLRLKGAKVERVYWLFDENDKIEPSGVDVQHAFAFDDKVPQGATKIHRVDAFFRVGDKYKSASARITTSNQRLDIVAAAMMDAVKIMAAETLHGKWSLRSVSLAKYNHGKFETTGVVPTSFQSTGSTKEALFTYSDIASALNFKSTDQAKEHLSEQGDIWASVEYILPDGKTPVTILKKLTKEEN